jgi:hypothetical protein
MFLAAASLSTGCIIEGETGNVVAVNWDIVARDATSPTTWVNNPASNLGCPVGFDTARFIAQPVDNLGNVIGSDVFDLFNCASGAGITAGYDPGLYKMWVEITNDAETQLYAQSAAAYVDLSTGDASFNAEIVDNGGYFSLAWSLSGNGSSSSCSQVIGENGVSVLATVTGSADAYEDLFDCEQGAAVTAALPHGSYTVATALLNQQDQSIGDAPVQTNRIIDDPNEFVDLGTLVIALQ